MGDANELLHIFTDCQQSKRSHKTHSKKLATLLQSSKNNQLKNILTHGLLDQILIYPKSDPGCNRVMEFFSLLMTTVDATTLEFIVKHLCARLKSTAKIVRQKVLTILEGFFQISAEEQLELSVELITKIIESGIERLHDKIPSVRHAAVKVLRFLQDADDENDPVVEALLHSFHTDSSAQVRKAVAQHITLHEYKTKPALLKRLKDVQADVRAAIYERFVEETDIRQFTKENRVNILVTGLTDRDKAVVSVAERLLLRWYDLLQKDLIKFLNYFGGSENEQSLYLIASVLSEKLPVNQENEVEQELPIQYESIETMNSAILIWLYVRCGYISQFSNKFNLIKYCEAYLPTPEEFLTAMKTLTTFEDDRFQVYIKYLLLLAPYIAQATDITGHKLLQEGALEVLETSITAPFEDSVIVTACKTLGLLDAEIVSGPRAATLVFSLLQRALSPSSSSTDSDGNAGEVSGVLMAAPCLQWLVQQQLQWKKAGKPASGLVNFQEILPAITSSLQQTDAMMRASAIAAVGMLALYEEDVRGQYFGLLRQIAFGHFEEEGVRCTALKAVVDNLLSVPESIGEDHKNAVFSSLATAITQSFPQEGGAGQLSPDAWALFVESAAKLVFGGVSNDPYLVSKLLYTFFVGPVLFSASENASLISGASHEQQTLEASYQRVQQLLSVLFAAYVAKHDASFETLRESITLLVSDLTMAVRDGYVASSVFAQAFQKLFGICDRVYDEMVKQKKETLSSTTTTAFTSLKMTAFACTVRELLKLDGQSKQDKATAKDMVRTLAIINTQVWLPQSQAAAVKTVLQALLKEPAVRGVKLLEKQVSTLQNDLQTVNDAGSYDSISFFDTAPGLKDLMQSSSSWNEDASVMVDEEHSMVLPKRRAARAARAAASKQVQEDDEDEDEEEDEDEDEEEDSDDEEEEDEEDESLPPSRSRRAFT